MSGRNGGTREVEPEFAPCDSPAMSVEQPPSPVRARFNPLIRPYLVLTIGITMVATVIGIPVALVWFCGAGQWWARHYFARLECELGERMLRYRKGILFQIEKTIPLENIQDVTFVEGPILRRFHLSILKFETAGQSQGQAHDMRLVGIIDAHDFRDRILEARQKLKQLQQGSDASARPATTNAEASAALARIQASLAPYGQRGSQPFACGTISSRYFGSIARHVCQSCG